MKSIPDRAISEYLNTLSNISLLNKIEKKKRQDIGFPRNTLCRGHRLMFRIIQEISEEW